MKFTDNRKSASAALALLVTAALSLARGGLAAQATQNVDIGFAGPMTGPQAHYGKDFRNGIVLAVEDFNATKPMIDGQPVRIVLHDADDQADPRTGTLVAQKLVDDGIKGVLGHFNSGTTIPASRVYAEAGVPQIAMATAAGYTRQGYKTTFRMMTSDSQQGAISGAFAVKNLGFTRIAIVDDRSAYGQGLADQFERAAKAAGATIVDREFTSDKAVDFKAVLTKIKGRRPQAIFYGGADSQAGPLARQMHMLGMNATLIGGEMVKTDTFLKIAGASASGTVALLAGLPTSEMPGAAAYMARYRKRFGEDVQTYSPYACGGAMSMFEAMQKADSTDPAKYLPVLARISVPGVTTNEIAYDRYGDLRHGAITMYKVIDGKWTTLQSVRGE